jgi:glyoxylate/hydroxypyruvate reductase A
MTAAIPFVHRLTPGDEQMWLAAFRVALPDLPVAPLRLLDNAARAAAEVAIVANPDPADLVALPALRWVQSLWAGVERLVREAPPHLDIVRLVDPQLAASMAEAVLAWTLYLHRGMPRYARQQAARRWEQHDLLLPAERRIGILGLGHMGAASAQRLAANGFEVSGWSATSRSVAGVDCCTGTAGLDSVLAESDIVVALLPLTPATHGLLGAERLARMKPGASLINFARGAIIDSDALLERLDARAIDHAVLDVFTTEPLPANDPLWRHPHVTVLPHISAPTNRGTAAAIAARNLRAWRANGTLPATVNRQRGY